MLDESEIYVKELSHTIINLYKLAIEDMGYDMGDTNNEIEYRNYLSSDPIYFYKDDESTIENGDTIDSSIDFSNYIGGIISIDKLMQIYPKANRNYAAAAVSVLDKYGDKVGLNDKGKLMVLAQFAHESGNFIYTHEIGSGKGRSYGRPSGPYGKVYYGRGPIQITWEANYKQITQNCFPKIGITADIHKDPDLCCRNLEIGCAASLCWFMLPGNGKKAVAAANAGDVKALTKAINGGYNGLQDRVNNTNKIFKAVQS
jgi:predicted chitinase